LSAKALFPAPSTPLGAFWVDPESPYHKEIFESRKHFILYCHSAWRSALATATLVDMGLAPVSHIEGGFAAWKKAGGPIEGWTHKH
jgi:rhodanese-related sulfurtransferase